MGSRAGVVWRARVDSEPTRHVTTCAGPSSGPADPLTVKRSSPALADAASDRNPTLVRPLTIAHVHPRADAQR